MYIGMNNYSMYDPAYCDGEPCPRDCDKCPVADKILGDEEKMSLNVLSIV